MARTKQTSRKAEVSARKPVKIASKAVARTSGKGKSVAKPVAEPVAEPVAKPVKVPKPKPAAGRVDAFSDKLAHQVRSLLSSLNYSGEVHSEPGFEMEEGPTNARFGRYKTLDSLYHQVSMDLSFLAKDHPDTVFHVSVDRTENGKYDSTVHYWIKE